MQEKEDVLFFQAEVLPEFRGGQGFPQLRFLLVQLVHAQPGRLIEDPRLQRLDQIRDGALYIRQRCFQRFRIGRVRILLQIISVGAFCDKLQQRLILHERDCVFQYKGFDPFLANQLLVATALALPVAGIIVVRDSGFPGTADAHHRFAAFAAEQLFREDVIHLGPFVRGCALVVLQQLLYLIEGFLVDDGRNGVLHADLILEPVNADIGLILQDRAETVMGERSAVQCPQAFLIQDVNDLDRFLSLQIEVVDQSDRRRGLRIDVQLFVRPDLVPEAKIAAEALSLLGGGTQTALHILGKLLRVVGRHAFNDGFKDNALRCIWDRFSDIVDFNAALFEPVLVERDLFLVAADAVRLPDDQCVKGMLGRVRKHQLKLFAVVVPAGHGAVTVFADDCQVVGRGKFLRFRKLSLNGLLALPVTGIARVDNGIHPVSPSSRGSSRIVRTTALSFSEARSYAFATRRASGVRFSSI